MRCVAVDDQRVDAEMVEPRRGRQAGLAAAHDQHGRVVVGVGARLAALVEPVLAAEVARVLLGVAQPPCGRPSG